MSDPFAIIRQSDGTLLVELGPRGAIDIDLSSGWCAHVIAEVRRQVPPRIVVDASRSPSVASAFFSGLIRIRESSGLGSGELRVRLGSDRACAAAKLLGMEQLVTLEPPPKAAN